jgi:signal transduction histidine kinase
MLAPVSKASRALAPYVTSTRRLVLWIRRLGRRMLVARLRRPQASQARRTVAAQGERDLANDLFNANAVLRRSADRLASHPQPTTRAYLDAVLLEASLAAGARSACFFQIDASRGWLAAVACAIDHRIVDIGTDPRMALFRNPVPLQALQASVILQKAPFRWVCIAEEAHLLWQFTVPWHKEMGHKSLALFPLLAGNTVSGMFALCFTTEERPTTPKLELCATLSQHAALAIELNRLSEDARQAAVQAEQEKAARELAAELSNANAAMQRPTARLTDLNDLDAFVIEVLKTVEDVTGATGSTVLLYDHASRTLSTQTIVHRGQAHDVATDPEMECFRGPVALEGVRWERWNSLFGSSGYQWTKVGEHYRTTSADWHWARGNRTIVHFPLGRNSRRIGILAVAFRETFPPVPASLDRMGVLAQQLILALETGRLGEEAKQAAIALEREKAAAERAEEMARANASLRTTLDILAQDADLPSFLRHVLAEAMLTLAASDGMVFVFDSETDTLRPAYSVLDPSLDTGPIPYIDSSFPSELSGAWSALVQARKPLVFQIDRDGDQLPPALKQWHQLRGTRALAGVPMFLGSEAFGYFCIALRREADGISAFSLDQLQALVQQAALGLQLARLANAQSKEAVSREQARAAHERSAELVKANEVMNRTGSRLIHASDPDAILPVIVSEACSTMGATEGALFEFRPESEELAFLCGFRNRQQDTPPFWDPDNPIRIAQFPAWVELLTRHKPVFEATSAGASGIMQSVLFMGSQPLGLFILRFSAECRPTETETEMFNTLVQQATLALQMVRLSKEAEARVAEAATLEERNRIAREIHDTLAQSFTGLIMQLSALDQARAGNNTAGIDAHLQIAVDIAQRGLAEARRSVKALRPAELEGGSLIDALKIIAGLTEQQSGIRVVIECHAISRFIPTQAAEVLRIVQEAITNAVKHARPTLITVSCQEDAMHRIMCIVDNGVGFQPDQKTEGFGLVGMRERAFKIGGELRIESGPEGSSVSLTVPVSRSSE